MKTHSQSWKNQVILWVIFLAGIGIRLYDLTDPPLDFHPVRQLRSAILARSAYYQMDSSKPTDLRQQAASLAELEVYEPPMLETLVGFTYFMIGAEHLWISRIYLALFWAAGGLAILALLRRYASFWASILGLSIYFYMPFSVIASRSFQPDPWMVMWILMAANTACRWSETRYWKWALLTAGLAAVALLVKVVAALFLGFMLAALVLEMFGIRRLLRTAQVWVVALITLAPSAIYYLLLNPQRSSGFMAFWTGSLAQMVLTSSFYADWLAMIKGLISLPIFLIALLGILLTEGRIKALLCGAWTGYFLYGLVFPYQYITHEYYHLPIVALAALSLPPILDVFLEKLKAQYWVWRVLAACIFVFSIGYSIWVARSILYASDYRNEPISWKRVGDAVPIGSKIVAMTGDYGMRLRYYGWRRISSNWASSADLNLFSLAGNQLPSDSAYFEEMTRDMDYFLVTALHQLETQPSLKAQLERCQIFAEGDGYVIFDLQHPVK